MLSDAVLIPAGARLPTDVCVIGAGPAGIALALELRGSGHDVLMLESGGLRQERRPQALARGGSSGEAYYRLERTRIRAFGGTSQHWLPASFMRARPLDALDFEARAEIGRDGWPFGRDALEGSYRRAQQICRLGPFDYTVERWSALAEDPPLPLGADAENVSFQAAPLDNFTGRLGELADAGDVHVLLHATALELCTAADGERVVRVEVAGPRGRRFSVEPRVVVLAAGGIDNPRLLLNSTERRPAGLGNGGDAVGRYFMEHPHVRTGVVRLTRNATARSVGFYHRRVLGGTMHIGMIKPSDAVLRRDGLLASSWILHPEEEGLASPPARAIADLRDVWRHRVLHPDTLRRAASLARRPQLFHAVARRALRLRRDPTMLKLSVMLEQPPRPDSRVLLGRDRDSNRQRLPHLVWRVGSLEHQSIAAGQRALDRALRAKGIGHVEDFYDRAQVPPLIVGGFHHIGTTRMSASPRDGVVDPDQRLHEVPNCYVTGSSIFPTAGYANPTLTIVALAVRLGAHLRARLGHVPEIRPSGR